MLGPSVLVADDMPDAREVLSSALELEGYQVVQAATGREALECAAQHSPSVIIMDLQMPQMDGLEATRRLKDHPRLRHIPVIAYTAFPTELPTPDLFSAVLAKPCLIDTVLQTIKQYRRPTPIAGSSHMQTDACLRS